jgi:hypothetical protein
MVHGDGHAEVPDGVLPPLALAFLPGLGERLLVHLGALVSILQELDQLGLQFLDAVPGHGVLVLLLDHLADALDEVCPG